ncbi:hypothetical protein KM546_gp11 [Porcine lymphotropic herpesvirus 3]|uniref:Uncharacterized protein n=2 Tax=Macavirus suidgamma5 TaxID=3050359 RepID=Q772U9_9GAMA|nr:hypothetical protein KM546_gp11 [Porcine lymphotropic herpesvirus 3]AAO12304.1 unknown [Porcine lymphotropic herpesvirus 3]AAO12318.1 unknown [Porcine lymphotropic herpesvirus 3]
MSLMRTRLRTSFKRMKKSIKTMLTANAWTFTIYRTYIRFTNNKKLKLTANDGCLPPCSSLENILHEEIPGYFYNSILMEHKQITLKFLLFGDSGNAVATKLQFICDSVSEINIEIKRPKYVDIAEGALVFYIVPLDIVTPRGLHLKCLGDKHDCIMNRSCVQEASEICSGEPIVHVFGQVGWSMQEEFPYLLTQKTKFMKSVCRIHTPEGNVCPVHAIRYGDNYCKIYINKSWACDHKETVHVRMSMVKDALLCFKFNPYVGIQWKWNENTIPIVYMGPTVLIPGCCATSIEYTNKYYCMNGTYITAFIVNISSGDVDFEIETCQWMPESTAEIMVKNNSPFPRRLDMGTQLGQAYFILAERYVLGDMLPESMLKRLSTCVILPGNIYVNATKLTKLTKTSCCVNCIDLK